MTEKNGIQQWSDAIAAFAVDALLQARIIQEADCERAIEIVAEEIKVRLCLGDYPPENKEQG